MKNYKWGQFFQKGIAVENLDGTQRMKEQIDKIGGTLHFTIEKVQDGWTAQCDEIMGIVTGGTNSNPTDQEIEDQIREAIYAAFHVSVKESAENKMKSSRKIEFSYV